MAVPDRYHLDRAREWPRPFRAVSWCSVFQSSVDSAWFSPGWLVLLQQRSGRIVIMSAANVFMFRAGPVRLQRKGGLSIQPAFQNRLQALVGARLQLEGTLTGRFEPGISVCFAEAHDTQTSPVAHLGMRPAFQNRAHHLRRGLAMAG